MGGRAVGFVLVAGAATAGLVLARRRFLTWGATQAECGEVLPGDDLVAAADLVATRAVTVRAAADVVWPWVAQVGQGKGGFYSYDALENLVGCDIRSADDIVAQWQDVRVGDPFRLHPDVALEVRRVDPGRSLVVGGGVTMGATPPPYDFSWAFVLREQADGSTRLLVRERYGYTAWWARVLVEPVEGVSFLMTQKMLRGIRDRAEREMATREMNRR
jgi:hypothetical protein